MRKQPLTSLCERIKMATTRTQAQIQSDISNSSTCPGTRDRSLIGVVGDRVGDGPNDLDWYGYAVFCNHCQTSTRVKVVSARWNNGGFRYPVPTIVSSSISGTTATVTINANSLGTHTKSTTINHKTYSVPSTLTNELNEARARDNAVNAFDSLYTTASRATSSSTLSSNISTLNSYLNTIGRYAGTSSSYYTSRKAKYDTLNNLNTAIIAFDNLNLSTTPNSSTATEAKRQLDIILTNAGSSYEGYTSRLAKYNTYVANLSTTEQLNISVGSLRDLHTNISGTMLPDKVSRYTDIHTRGTEEYNATKSYIEENFRRNS